MERLRTALVTDRTQADVNTQNDKGTYNYTDLNRVLRACAWVAERLERYGHTVPFDYYQAYLASAQAQPEYGGMAKGALGYSGETVTVQAAPAAGFWFIGWMENGETVSSQQEYSFTAERDRDLIALYEATESANSGIVDAGRVGSARVDLK